MHGFQAGYNDPVWDKCTIDWWNKHEGDGGYDCLRHTGAGYERHAHCPAFCYNQGTCSGGKCSCSSKYVGADCRYARGEPT